jgi:pSer/pThr/pTyr-binding forkhead associated (FHA) protein
VFKLSIEDDEGKTTVVPLARDEMTIGRQEGNTIRLTERNVSRRHARLSRQSGTIFIEDLASFTGVRVNGTKIVSATPLREGDELQIGDYRIVVRGEQPVAADRPTMPTMPAVNGPMATVGGAVAIPGRASVAAMAAQPAVAQAAAAAVPVPRPRTKTSPPQPITAVPENAPAVELVESQPTIPLRAMPDESPERPAQSGPPARLVVLTTDIAGLEIRLDKPSLVIGRTNENDAVLSHRSISRHHAKIVREGERFTIVDLQSANGVRVNGEDYERIELSSGDVVELGHVKLRFVAPQEQFVFDARASAITGRRRVPAQVVALGGGALVALVLVVMFWHRSRPATEAPEPVAASAPAAAPSPPPAEPAPAAAAPAAPPAPALPATPAAVLAATRKAMAAEDWAAAQAALGHLDPATADAGARREAATLARKIEAERQSASLYARFDEAASAKDYAAVVAGYAQIPADSVYKKRALPQYDEARGALIAQHTTAAEQARSEGRCADMRVEAGQVLRLDPKNVQVRELSKLCRAAQPAAAAPPVVVAAAAGRPPSRSRPLASAALPDRPEPPARRAEASKPEPTEAAAAGEGEDPQALMKQAREAWLRQQCGAAMDLSRRALRAKPNWTDAYQILAVCSCSLKDAEAAEHAYARLDDRNRSLVHAVCQKNGISVGQ